MHMFHLFWKMCVCVFFNGYTVPIVWGTRWVIIMAIITIKN